MAATRTSEAAPEATETLSPESLKARREDHSTGNQLLFRVAALYGLSRESVRFPVSPHEAIDSGQVCVTLDPEGDLHTNLGIVDFKKRELTVRYGVQAVFPGLFQLVTQKRYDPAFLNPVRAVATDRCTVSEDFSGWRALGCLEFLPGSLWAGAGGG